MSYTQAAPPPRETHETHNSLRGADGGRRSERAAKRPAALLALLASAVASAISAFIGAVIVYTGGNGLAESNVKDVIQQHPDVVGLPAGMTAEDVKQLTGPLWQELVDDRAGTLSSRAGFAVFVGACMLLSVLFARRAALWSRVLVTVWGGLGIVAHLLVVTDYEPASVTALSWLAIACGAAAAVLCWVPAVRRFAGQQRAAR